MIETGAPGSGAPSLAWYRSRVEGPAEGLHVTGKGSRAEVGQVQLAGGRGPALYVAGGQLSVREVQVTGFEYALQSGTGATVTVEGLLSVRADLAGVALLRSEARLSGVEVRQAGPFGGLQLLESVVVIERLTVYGSKGPGLLSRLGRLELRGAQIGGGRGPQPPDEGGLEGLQLRGGRATLQDVVVRETQSAGLLATAGAQVSLRRALFERGWTGIEIERAAAVSAAEVRVRGPTQVGLVVQQGQLSIDGLRFESTAPAVWADCDQGARVHLSHVTGALNAEPPDCVSVR